MTGLPTDDRSSINRSTLVLVGALLAAYLGQVVVLTQLSWSGVVPNLVLLTVAVIALLRGPDVGMAAGFATGLLIDLSPPSDHTVGRWALALLVVGYLAGSANQSRRPRTTLLLGTLAAASLIGTSLFAVSGLVLGDAVAAGGVTAALQVIAMAFVLDLVLIAVASIVYLRFAAEAKPTRRVLSPR